MLEADLHVNRYVLHMGIARAHLVLWETQLVLQGRLRALESFHNLHGDISSTERAALTSRRYNHSETSSCRTEKSLSGKFLSSYIARANVWDLCLDCRIIITRDPGPCYQGIDEVQGSSRLQVSAKNLDTLCRHVCGLLNNHFIEQVPARPLMIPNSGHSMERLERLLRLSPPLCRSRTPRRQFDPTVRLRQTASSP